MLCDPARFTARDIGFANRIEQRRFTMVNVTHDSNNRRTRFEIIRSIGRIKETFFDIRFSNTLHRMSQFFSNELGRVSIDHIRDLHHLPLLHEEADNVDCSFCHTVGEFLNRDDFRNCHFA